MTQSFASLAMPDAPPGARWGWCALCGASTVTGHPSALSDNFVEMDRLAHPRSPVTCAPCTALLGASPRVSAKASGKALGWRMFSLLARQGRPLAYANKAEKPRIRSWVLTAPYPEPWGLVIADSGKKQLAPFAPVNVGRSCRVQFETLVVAYEPAVLAAHLAVVDRLYALGWSKAELASGAFGVGRLRTANVATIHEARTLMRAVARVVTTPVHALAVWLATKEEDPDAGPDDE